MLNSLAGSGVRENGPHLSGWFVHNGERDEVHADPGEAGDRDGMGLELAERYLAGLDEIASGGHTRL